jgi:hypothetical protein
MFSTHNQQVAEITIIGIWDAYTLAYNKSLSNN